MNCLGENNKMYLGKMKLVLSVIGGIFLVLALIVAGFIGFGRYQGNPPKAQDPLAIAIRQETAKLLPKQRTIILPSEKALAAKAAIKHGDYVAASRISAEILANSTLQNWRFYPFNNYVDNFVVGEDDAHFEENLNKWIKQDKDSAITHLILADYYIETGWKVRGNNFTAATQDEHYSSFQNYVKLATEEVKQSIQLDANNPYAYYELLKILSADGNTKAMEIAFQEAIKKYPDYYTLYGQRMNTLEPKWGGSLNAMYLFTEHYAGSVSDNSPLKLLYLKLYAKFLDTAWSTCQANEGDDLNKCVNNKMSKIVSDKLANQIYVALDLYNKADPHQFTLAIKPILSDMVSTPGGEHYAGEILQLAASRMGSQNQLVNNNIGQNNYMLDEITAKTWFHAGHYDNALKKYEEALIDIEHAPFPNEEEKDIALSDIYDEISDVYTETSQFATAIAYQNAAIAMGGDSYNEYRYLKCYAYYQLKHYGEAVQECSNRISKGADIQTRYWRGKSYKALGQMDAALQDFSVVADSEDHHFRTSAAIEVSVIYGNRKDMQNLLASLNKHPYLFDEKDQSKKDLAVSYNNRCFAYMQLGQLRKALNDCTASLNYGSLPDAYQKQQELVKKLKSKQI